MRGAVGSGFAGGGALDRLAPGPDLADFTADAWARELTALSDDELVGVLCAWRRLGSWAMAGELAAVGELARRRPGPGLNEDGHLDEEVAAALTLTGWAAARRAVLAADPQAGIRRRQRAEKNARVDAWTETSGTGALAGRGLPPAEMIAADKRVDALARWLKAHGAPGTLDQLRAQVFTALLAGRPVADLLPAPAGGGLPGAESAESGWPGLSGSVNLTLPLTPWLGLSGQPGEVAGLGPLDAGACRDLADLLARQPATWWCITLTGPGGRAVAHGCAPHRPQVAPPADRPEPDRPEPDHPEPDRPEPDHPEPDHREPGRPAGGRLAAGPRAEGR